MLLRRLTAVPKIETVALEIIPEEASVHLVKSYPKMCHRSTFGTHDSKLLWAACWLPRCLSSFCGVIEHSKKNQPTAVVKGGWVIYNDVSTYLRKVSTNLPKDSSSRTKLKKAGKSRPSSFPSSAFTLLLLLPLPSSAVLSCGRNGTSLSGVCFSQSPRQVADPVDMSRFASLISVSALALVRWITLPSLCVSPVLVIAVSNDTP